MDRFNKVIGECVFSDTAVVTYCNDLHTQSFLTRRPSLDTQAATAGLGLWL